MRFIKNFLHNVNDIALAVIIVVVAAGIIYWRMQIILDYPKQLADQQAVYMEESDQDAAEDAAAEDASEGEQSEDNEATPDANSESEEQPQG